MSKSPIDALKHVVEENFGQRILSAGNCLQLCDAIQKKTTQKININTVRRYFGLVKTAYKPSVTTLNIFAQYCGYKGYGHFEEHFGAQPKKEVKEDAEKKLVQYLVSIFEKTEVQHNNDPTYLNLVKQTILYLQNEEELVRTFQKAIAKTKNGQLFYFQQFVNIDKLASYYGDGLEYYLEENKSKSAQLFGNGLLGFRAWLTQDEKAFIHYYNKMAQYSIDEKTHPYIGGQYFAIKLFYTAVTSSSLDSVVAEARLFYNSIKPSKENYRFFPGFEMVLSDALIMVKEYDEALFYIQAALKKREQQLPAYLDRSMYQAFQLFYAIALACTGKIDKAKVEASKINSNDFFFLRQKYYSIYYLFLQQLCGKKSPKIKAQLQYLIQNTGFTFF